MKKKTRRICTLTIFVGLAALGLSLYLTRHQPIARVLLSDGTELRLEYVTYGTEHSVEGATRPVAWLTRLAQKWPKLGIPVYENDYRYSVEKPEIAFWFSRKDLQTGELIRGLSKELRVDFQGRQLASSGVELLPMPNARFSCDFFDRRRPEIPLVLNMKGEKIALTAPNPAAKLSFPVWQPGPVPQTRRVGDLEFVLGSFSAELLKDKPGENAAPFEYGAAEFQAVIEFSLNDRPADGVAFVDQLEISDATGNVGGTYYVPPFSEPAWKLRRPFLRTGNYPFAPTDGLTLGPAPIPADGEYTILKVPEAEQKQGLRLAALLGPGAYEWKDGKFRDAPANFTGYTNGTWTIRAVTPVVALLYDEQTPPAKWRRLSRGTALRLHWSEGSYGLSRYYHSMPNETDNRSFELYRLEKGHDASPKPGMPVSIQLVPVEVEFVEFIVAPPKLATPTPEDSATGR